MKQEQKLALWLNEADGDDTPTWLVAKRTTIDFVRKLTHSRYYVNRKPQQAITLSDLVAAGGVENEYDATTYIMGFTVRPPTDEWLDLESAALNLTRREREMLVFHVLGYSGIELSKAFGVSESRITQILKRTQSKLRAAC